MGFWDKPFVECSCGCKKELDEIRQDLHDILFLFNQMSNGKFHDKLKQLQGKVNAKPKQTA